MSLHDYKRPTLKDKHAAQEKALKAEAQAIDAEVKAVKKEGKRASKIKK